MHVAVARQQVPEWHPLAAVRPAHRHVRRASCSPSKWSDFKLASSLHVGATEPDPRQSDERKKTISADIVTRRSRCAHMRIGCRMDRPTRSSIASRRCGDWRHPGRHQRRPTKKSSACESCRLTAPGGWAGSD